jgi:hypothetical protein
MQSANNYERFVNLQKEMDDIFSGRKDRLKIIRDLAILLSAGMAELDSLIQQHTAIVCPECSSVCCINRHSYHSLEDIAYIYALGKKIPHHASGLEDFLPCQFLGEKGCTLSRSLRPYRCNWYFCSPLLEHIQQRSSRYYSRFIYLLQDITGRRQKLIREFASLTKQLHSKNASTKTW